MLRWTKEVGLVFLTLAASSLAGVPAGHSAPRKTPEAKPVRKKLAKKPSKSAELVKKLRQPITLEMGFEPNTPLKDALEFFSGRYDLMIVVDTAAFKAEQIDVEEAKVILPRLKEVPFTRVLSLLLNQLPVKSTYLVRNGILEITTAGRAAPECLLRQKVIATFDNQPLQDALEVLADAAAVTVIVDARVGDKAQKPVTATFRNDVDIETAVRLLADMVDSKAIRIGGSLYVTTPAHARELEAAEKQKCKEHSAQPGKDRKHTTGKANLEKPPLPKARARPAQGEGSPAPKEKKPERSKK